MLRVHFLKSRSVAGWFIRLFTFSRWNHVAIEIDGQVYEARGRTGVTRRNADGYLDEWVEVATVEVTVPRPDLALAFFEAQIGKKYDYLAIVALPFRKSWQSTERWFCSEYITGGLVAGLSPKMRIEAHRVTPRDLWIRL